MRITHVIDYFHTDVGYQEYYLAKAQALAGHEVTVLASARRHHAVGPPGLDEGRGSYELALAGVQVRRLPSVQLGHDRAWLVGLERALHDAAPDAVHGHSAFGATPVRLARACTRLGIPLLIDNHIQATGAPASGLALGRAAYASYRRAFRRLLTGRVAHWVADEPAKRDFLASRLGIPPEAIELIPLGFDPGVFRFAEPRRHLLRSTRGWGDDLVVAVTGKLSRAKRTDHVAGACEDLARTGVPVRLIVAGAINPEHLAEVRAAAPTLRREDRIETRPLLPRHQLADLFLAADVAAFPGLTSISIFEALGTGARVIVPGDESGLWLASLCAHATPAPPNGSLITVLERVADRSAAAGLARAALSWEAISDRFVERYLAADARTPVGAVGG